MAELSVLWESISSGALNVVGAIGGFAFLAKSFFNFISSMIAKKIDAKNAKELEQVKVHLLNKNYISKTRFDIEIQLYRELSGLFFELVKNVQSIIPNGIAHYPSDAEERQALEERYHSDVVHSLNSARECLYKNAPFMPEDFHNRYMDIVVKCHAQVALHELELAARKSPSNKEHIIKAEHFVKTREIIESYKVLNNDLRAYLSKLDVVD